MVAVNKIKDLIAERGYTQEQTARKMGICPKSFYNKLKKGKFGTDEAEKLIEILHITNPIEIFFAENVTCEVTKGATE